MRRITTMFLLLLGCSGDSDDETTTTTITTPPPTSPDITTQTDTTAASDTSTSTGTTPTSTTDDPATSAPMTGSSETTADGTTAVTTADDTTTGPPPVDCNAPPDCTSCWVCAKTGPCKAAYDACAIEAFCAPTLACFEGTCTPDGIQPDCAATCCKSCTDLGTCDAVNGALSCVLPMCAALCGQGTCG